MHSRKTSVFPNVGRQLERMTSATGQTTAIPIDHLPSSEPESLDSLDYDDWEGQFEFVGTTAAQNQSARSNGSGDVDDLNFTTPNYTQPINNRRPILIDEETFLSLQSTDGNHIDHSIDPFQSNQTHIIENALKHLQFDKTTVPLTTNADRITTDETNAMPSDSSHFDRILRLKNRLNNTKCNLLQPGDTNNNHTNNNNDNKHKNKNSQSRISDCSNFVWNDDDDNQMDNKIIKRRYSNEILCDTLLKEQVSHLSQVRMSRVFPVIIYCVKIEIHSRISARESVNNTVIFHMGHNQYLN